MGRKRDAKFNVRYGERWRYDATWKRQAHEKVGHICCLCAKRRSVSLHHARYVDDNGKKLVDREEVGIDVFPVCEKCHDSILHSASAWYRDKADPVWQNRNREEYQLLLKSRFSKLSKLYRKSKR